MFSAREKSSTSPRRCRSSGMCPRPASSESFTFAVVMSSPSTATRPACSGRSPVIASISSVWPLPSTPGDADDLAGADLERDAAHLLDLAIVDDAEAFDDEQRLAGLPGGLVDAEQHLAADHQARQPLPRSRRLPGIVSIFFPRRSTVIRSAISVTSFSLWLMKMIDFPAR